MKTNRHRRIQQPSQPQSVSKNIDTKVSFSPKTICDGHHNVKYRGVTYLKNPFDYVMYQMIINEVKPDLIIEVGTRFGGGALYMADILDVIGKGEVHTIDIVDYVDSSLVKTHPRIKRFLKGYQGYDLKETDGFETILVIEDASHTYQDCKAAIEKFAPLVSKDSYLIVEDGIVTELKLEGFSGGPLKAISEFLPNHSEFIVDKKWCNFFGNNAKHNVSGFLKKVSLS